MGKHDVQQKIRTDREGAAAALQEICDGLSSGEVKLHAEERSVTLSPDGVIKLRTKAASKDDKETLTLKLSWRVSPAGQGDDTFASSGSESRPAADGVDCQTSETSAPLPGNAPAGDTESSHGWRNSETWFVFRHIWTTDEKRERAATMAQECWAAAEHDDAVRNNAQSRRESASYWMSERLRDWLSAGTQLDPFSRMELQRRGLEMDLAADLAALGLQRVDWLQIADYYLEQVALAEADSHVEATT